MEPAIRVEGIGKQYAIGARGPAYRTLRESVMEGLASPWRWFGGEGPGKPGGASIWAIRDLTFAVASGEVVGIIGRNGAGKSTLLRVLSGITKPTCGRAELRGRVGSLLDVGTGFHSELTGRENIFLNGAILGMTRKEIQSKLDEIIEFAGVESFLDTPVKHYSSGMRVRLAFAVAAHLDTELLFTDEVLAVGDAVFQRKCIDEIGSIARQGRTVLFVSHNMGAVSQLCGKTILLDQGRLFAFGKTHEVIKTYLARFSDKRAEARIEPPVVDKGVAITRVAVTDAAGRPSGDLDWHYPFLITIEFQATRHLPALSLGVTMVNELGIRLFFSWAIYQQEHAEGSYRVTGKFPGEVLSPGRYYLDIGAELYGVETYHAAVQAVNFEIANTTGEFDGDLSEYGLLFSRLPWQVEPAAMPAPSPRRGDAVQ